MDFKVFLDKENTHCSLKSKEASNAPRTPLVDLRNKTPLIQNKGIAEGKSSLRFDALDLQPKGTPKRNNGSKQRRSCFASINNSEVTHHPSLTLPQHVEEEPEGPFSPAFSLAALRAHDGIATRQMQNLDVACEFSADGSSGCSSPDVSEEMTVQEEESGACGDSSVIAVVEKETDDLVELIVTECAAELSQLSKSWMNESADILQTPVFSPQTPHCEHPYSQSSPSDTRPWSTSDPSNTELSCSQDSCFDHLYTRKLTTDVDSSPTLSPTSERILSLDHLISHYDTENVLSSTPASQQTNEVVKSSLPLSQSAKNFNTNNENCHSSQPCSSLMPNENFYEGEEELRQRLSTSLSGLMYMSGSSFKEKLDTDELSVMIETYLCPNSSDEDDKSPSCDVNGLVDADFSQTTSNKLDFKESSCAPTTSFAMLSPSPSVWCHGIDTDDNHVKKSLSPRNTTECSTSYCKQVEDDTNTSLRNILDCSTNTSFLHITEGSTNTSFHQYIEGGTNTSIHHVKDDSTNTSFVANVHSSTTTDDLIGTADKSILSDLLHQIDADTNTSVHEHVDVSVLTDVFVHEQENKQTMTDRNQMIDAASGMTPLKQTKLGHRMTADDIRRQHPRTLANQLDSLQSANQRLEKEVKVTTQERDRLQTSLKDCRSKLQSSDKQLVELKDNHASDIALLEQLHEESMTGLQKCLDEKQKKMYKLEKDLDEANRMLSTTESSLATNITELQKMVETLETSRQEAELRHVNEIQRLQSEFEKTSYKDQFETSMKVITELQAEKEEFLGLMEDIEGAAASQFRLRDALHQLAHKSTEKVESQALIHKQMLCEQDNLRQKLVSLQVDIDIVHAENKVLQEDLEHANDTLQKTNSCLEEMETLYDNTCKDLTETQTRLNQQSVELEESTEALDQLLQTREMLTQQLSEQQDSGALACQALQESQEQLTEMEQILDQRSARLKESQAEKETMQTEYEETIAKLELYIQNLQLTLDSWEEDRDAQREVISELEEKQTSSEACVVDMQQELVALREIKATTQQERNTLEELKNTNQFLEAEKQLYIDAVTDFRTRLEAETELCTNTKEELETLQDNHQELQKQYQHMLRDRTEMVAELNLKSCDLEASSSLAEQLEQRMISVLTAVEKKFNFDVKLAMAKDRHRHSARKSLVSNVLSRTPRSHLTDQSPFPKQCNVEFGASAQKNGREASELISSLKKSSHSKSFCAVPEDARVVVKSKKCLSFCEPLETLHQRLDSCRSGNSSVNGAGSSKENSVSPEEMSRSVAGFAKIRSIPSTLNNSCLDRSERFEGSANSSSFLGLSESIRSPESGTLLNKVRSVEKMFNMFVKAMEMAEKSSESTIKYLQEDLDVLHKKLKFSESECQKKTEQLTDVNGQVEDLTRQLTTMNDNILDFQDQSFKITQLEEEKAELNQKLEVMEGEKKVLSSQLEDVIMRLDSDNDHKSDGACLREIVALKKQNNEYQVMLLDERKRGRELGEKAVKRLKILEGNWQKAETDCTKLDELIESIRQVCIKYQTRNTHPALLDIVRWIDGRHPSQSRSFEPTSRV